MPRAIASLTLSFGLVSIPVKLFSATEASNAVRFKLMRADGVRVRQQYVSDARIDERPERVTVTPGNSKRSSRQDPPPLAQSSNVRELRAADISPPQRALDVDDPAPSVVERAMTSSRAMNSRRASSFSLRPTSLKHCKRRHGRPSISSPSCRRRPLTPSITTKPIC